MKRETYSSKLLITLVLLLTVASCDVQNAEQPKQRAEISNDTQTLSERIIMRNGIAHNTVAAKTQNNNYRYLADVRTPALNGTNLSATSVVINGDYAYVSYHNHGEPYGGALDIIDISDPANPQITSHMKLQDTDINDLLVSSDGNTIWITGGRNPSTSGYSKEGHMGAIVAEVAVQNNQLQSIQNETALESYSGNSVEQVSNTNELAVSTGNTGGFFQVQKSDLSITNADQVDYAKHIDVGSDKYYGLSIQHDDQPSTFYTYNISDGSESTITTTTEVNPTNGKNVIDFHGGMLYAAMGDAGFISYDLSQTSSPQQASFPLKSGGLASGVDAEGSYLYMAAGSEGLYIAELPQLNQVYHWDRADVEGSANYVATDGDFIFLAKGVDALNILKKESASTKPTACPFDSNDGTVVEFMNNRLTANRNEADAKTDIADVSLSQGTYTVKLYGYDDHRNDSSDRSQQNQPNESFYVSLLQNGSEVATTGALGDLPDESNMGTRSTTIDNFELSHNIDKVQGVHEAYQSSGPNSLNAKCAAFKKK